MARKAIIGIAATALAGYIVDIVLRTVLSVSFWETVFGYISNIMTTRIPVWTATLFAAIVGTALLAMRHTESTRKLAYIKEYTTDTYLQWNWAWEYERSRSNPRKFTTTNLHPVCQCGGHLAKSDGYLVCSLCQRRYKIPSKEDLDKTNAYIASTIDTRYTRESARRNIDDSVRRIENVTSFKSADNVFSRLNELYSELTTKDKIRILINTINCDIKENNPEYCNQILATLESSNAIKLVLKRAYTDVGKRLPMKYKRAYKHKHPSIDHNHSLVGLTVEQAILR